MQRIHTDSANQPPPDARRLSLWHHLKDAIRGTEADYTKISLKKAIFLLAIPMILELLMESTFAVTDIYFVSKLGASAVATVGLTETFLFLVYALSIGLSTAVAAIVARRIGEKNKTQAGLTAIQSILLAILVSLPFTLAGIYYSKEMLVLMGADAWAVEQGHGYTQWMLGGNAIIMLLFVMNAVFRGAGDAAIAMRVLWIANGINIILDPMLIFGWGPMPAMGITGAAVATNIGRGIGVAVQLWTLFRGGKHIQCSLAHICWHTQIMMNLLRTSLGGIGQMIVAMTSWIFLMRILAGISTEAVAGATIALRIMLFTMMPAWGLSNAVSTLVGQNLGAGNPRRAESAVWKIGLVNMLFLSGVSILYYCLNEPLMKIFTLDEGVIAVGAEWLRILSYSYFVYAWWMVSTQAFNGAGDTRTPTLINLFFFWLLQVPLCYALSISYGWEQSGVFWGVFVSETSVGLFSLWLFTRGRWKHFKV